MRFQDLGRAHSLTDSRRKQCWAASHIFSSFSSFFLLFLPVSLFILSERPWRFTSWNPAISRPRHPLTPPSPKHTKGDSKMVFEIFLRCGTQAPGANCTWFRMMPGVNAGFLVPLGALAAPIDDTIGPVARLRVFRGRLSILKVIARWFSKSSWGAGLRLLEQIASDFAWCQGSTLAS